MFQFFHLIIGKLVQQRLHNWSHGCIPNCFHAIMPHPFPLNLLKPLHITLFLTILKNTRSDLRSPFSGPSTSRNWQPQKRKTVPWTLGRLFSIDAILKFEARMPLSTEQAAVHERCCVCEGSQNLSHPDCEDEGGGWLRASSCTNHEGLARDVLMDLMQLWTRFQVHNTASSSESACQCQGAG